MPGLPSTTSICSPWHHNQKLALETAALASTERCTILADYIAPGLVFNPETTCCRRFLSGLISLHQRGIPYNLVMIRDRLRTSPESHRIVLFPRDIDHEITSELPNDRPGAPAFWGKLITSHRQMFCDLDLPRLTRAFQKNGGYHQSNLLN